MRSRQKVMIKDNLSETDQMKQRIALAFDALEEADPARIMALENVVVARMHSGLGKRRQRKNRWWWIGGLLILSAASAAWWQVARHAINKSPTVQDRTTERRETQPIDRSETEGQTYEQPAPERRSPVIFRR